MNKKRITAAFFLAAAFMLSYMAYSTYTASMTGFAFDQAAGTFTCNMSGTDYAAGASTARGTFVTTSIDGNVAHVFSNGTSSGTPYRYITFTSNMLVDFNTGTVATSSMTTTFKKTRNGRATQYTSVAGGTFTAPDFSDLTMSSSGL